MTEATVTHVTSSTDSTDGVVERVVGTLMSVDQVLQAYLCLKTVGGRVFLVCTVVISASILILEVYGTLKGHTTGIRGHNITLFQL